MRAAPSVTTSSFLNDCFSVPQVRNRLEKGIKLQDLGQLKKFLEEHREQQFLKKEYGYLIQDLEFLETMGGLKLPVPLPGSFICVRHHWLALTGYYQINSYSLIQDEVESRFIINTPSVFTPVLILDSTSWAIYHAITKCASLTRYQALCYLLYVLEVLVITDSPVTEEYIRYVVSAHSTKTILQESLSSYLLLTHSNLIEDVHGFLPRMLNEDYCLPLNSWIFSDGWYFTISVPAWSLSRHGNDDYTGNYITGWDFFSTA